VLATLNHLIPLDTNAPSPEVVAAVQALRTARVTAATAAAAAAASGSSAASVSSADAGVEYIVPALAGLGREGVTTVLPQVSHSVMHDVIVKYKHLLYSYIAQDHSLVSPAVYARPPFCVSYGTLALCSVLQRAPLSCLTSLRTAALLY
jgi:hypothetical protein